MISLKIIEFTFSPRRADAHRRHSAPTRPRRRATGEETGVRTGPWSDAEDTKLYKASVQFSLIE